MPDIAPGDENNVVRRRLKAFFESGVINKISTSTCNDVFTQLKEYTDWESNVVDLLLSDVYTVLGKEYKHNQQSTGNSVINDVCTSDASSIDTRVEMLMSKAEQGNTDGQKKLGDCYFIGDGVEQDYEKAVYWYRKSAEQGDADAQNSLGNCYFTGKGVEQDHKKAVYWLKKSAKQGDSNAIKVLKDMGENCDL